MTCIVGIVHDNVVYMGADSAGANSRNIVARKDKKIFKNGDFLIGFTSSFRMGQLLRYNLNPPSIWNTPDSDGYIDLDRYMVTAFIPAVRECFKSGGYLTIHDNQESGGVFLVGVRSRLFKIDSDFQIAESIHNYDATGSGEEYALGSLHSTIGLEPDYRISKALEAAATFSTGVCEPFHIISI